MKALEKSDGSLVFIAENPLELLDQQISVLAESIDKTQKQLGDLQIDLNRQRQEYRKITELRELLNEKY